MKRSEMILDMASELVGEYPNIPFDKAQDIANVILNRIERAGMLPPIESYRSIEDLDLGPPEWENE